uniref:Uncharacterized protein n=1 Tax=Rhizophora mucronata TaxID=61149 RepID=A0A2P2PMN7_RHIMU
MLAQKQPPAMMKSGYHSYFLQMDALRCVIDAHIKASSTR